LFAFLEDKLQSVEKQYLNDLQKENQKWSSRTEKHLLELHKQWEQKKKKLLDEEVIKKTTIMGSCGSYGVIKATIGILLH